MEERSSLGEFGGQIGFEHVEIGKGSLIGTQKLPRKEVVWFEKGFVKGERRERQEGGPTPWKPGLCTHWLC